MELGWWVYPRRETMEVLDHYLEDRPTGRGLDLLPMGRKLTTYKPTSNPNHQLLSPPGWLLRDPSTTPPTKAPYVHQEFRAVPKMEGFLIPKPYNPILGVSFPVSISRIHTAYIGHFGFLHFRYLKSLMIYHLLNQETRMKTVLRMRMLAFHILGE